MVVGLEGILRPGERLEGGGLPEVALGPPGPGLDGLVGVGQRGDGVTALKADVRTIAQQPRVVGSWKKKRNPCKKNCFFFSLKILVFRAPDALRLQTLC